MTRCASTCVLPEPALAETQAEVCGSEARAWLAAVSEGMGYLTLPPRPRLRRRPTIRERGRDDRSRHRPRLRGTAARATDSRSQDPHSGRAAAPVAPRPP